MFNRTTVDAGRLRDQNPMAHCWYMTTAIALLQSALLLLSLVAATPNAPQSLKDLATKTAHTAIAEATVAINKTAPASSAVSAVATPTVTLPSGAVWETNSSGQLIRLITPPSIAPVTLAPTIVAPSTLSMTQSVTNPSPTSALFELSTTKATTARIFLTSAGSSFPRIVESTLAHSSRHIITATGLTPSTTYQYEAEAVAGSEFTKAAGTFITPATAVSINMVGVEKLPNSGRYTLQLTSDAPVIVRSLRFAVVEFVRDPGSDAHIARITVNKCNNDTCSSSSTYGQSADVSPTAQLPVIDVIGTASQQPTSNLIFKVTPTINTSDAGLFVSSLRMNLLEEGTVIVDATSGAQLTLPANVLMPTIFPRD